MKERAIDRERAIVTHHQAAKIPEPSVGAFDDPSSPVAPQRSAILRLGSHAILFVRADQFNPAASQTLSQRITVVRFVGDNPQRFLSWTPRLMAPSYPDRRERRFREFDFRRGCRVKVVSQRKTAAVDHHHPLRPLAPLGFPTPQPLFSREQNSRPETIRSTLIAGARLTRSETFARCSTKRPAPPNLAVAASTSKDAGISPAGPASEPRSAESTKSLPAHGGSRSTDDRPCVVRAAWGARARFSSTALRSATDRTAPSALLRRC